MIRDNLITDGAVMDLASLPHPAMRSKVLKFAIEIRTAEDAAIGRANAKVRSSGQKGSPTAKGKVTAKDVRSAKAKLYRLA